MSYTGKAFLYIEDGEVVVNPELKPPDDYETIEDLRYMADWESNNIPTKNVKQFKDWNGHVYFRIIEGGEWSKSIENGQPCHIENGKVVKLLT